MRTILPSVLAFIIATARPSISFVEEKEEAVAAECIAKTGPTAIPYVSRVVFARIQSPTAASLWLSVVMLGTNKFRLSSLIRLSYLAPGIIRALLAGRHPIALTPTRLLRPSKDLPHDWQEQHHFLGCAA
jgi:hypothetical protein